MCVLLEQLEEVVERAGAALTLKEWFAGVLAGLRGGARLASIANCVRARMCVDVVRVTDEDVRMAFVNSKLLSGGFCPSLDDYDSASNVSKASSLKRCMERRQKVYTSSKFKAQRKISNSFVPIGGAREKREEVWAGRVLLLFGCSVKGESDDNELAYVLYMKRATPLDELHVTLKMSLHLCGT